MSEKLEDLIKMVQEGVISSEEFKKHLDEQTLTYEKLAKMDYSDYENLKEEFPYVHEYLIRYDPFNKK
ncbi:MAG: hypothetical protein K5979_01440 [Ruminococcus sp.]|nr:hypothetical protein [Ruminococcus sp.]